jgi:hypothetical protein
MAMNKNMLSPVGFSFHIKKLPEINFFVQSVDIPGVNLGYAEMPNPFKKLPIYGDHWEYGDLVLNFKINEDLGNYIEIYNWLRGLAFPDEYPQFARLKEKDITGDGLESDGYCMIMSSAMNPVMKIDFEDLFPVDLSGFTMDSRYTDIAYVEATATFKFKKYSFTPM